MFPALWSRSARYAVFPVLIFLGFPLRAEAQQAPATLSLEEAITLARRNNPDFLAQRNDEIEADWAVREARGALLPSASIGGSMEYQAAGQQRFGIFTGEDIGVGATSTGYLLSSYSAGLSYRLSAETLMRPGQERANRVATLSRIEAADFTLVAEVTRQYLSVLRAKDGVELARQEFERAEKNASLAEARASVGASIALEAKQAEVEKGRAEVELLKAENLERAEVLKLVELIGIEFDGDLQTTSQFPVFAPRWSKDELIAMAFENHPQLRSLRAAQTASEKGVNMARSQYLPSMQLDLGWSGYTREATNPDLLVAQAQATLEQQRLDCIALNEILTRLTDPMPQDCSASRFTLTDAQRASIIDGNDVFPFKFTRSPFSAQLRVSLPIFNGFTRERRIESARVAADDARHRLRKEELRIKTEVATIHQNLETAYRAVAIEERNKELAGQQLDLARERYTVGAISFVDLLDAETLKARADRAYLQSVYAFHENLAALEAAVGRKLERPEEEY